MDAATLAALEFDRVRTLIHPFLRTPGGRRALERLEPLTDESEIAARKAGAGESIRHHLDGGRLGPGATDDPDPVIERLAPLGAVLDPIEIARLTSVIQAADSLRQDLSPLRDHYPRIWRIASAIPDLRGATRPIEGRISADGRIEDHASVDLGNLRRRIAALEAKAQSALQSIVDHAASVGLLQDAYVTVRGGRFVIPVRAEARSSMPGVVHGASGTGATVFVEPLETLELNNQVVTLRDEEVAEVRRILSEWSESLRSRLPEIRTACERLAQIDLLGAIGVFGVTYGAAIAGDGSGGNLSLIEARHPVLLARLRARGAESIPLTLEMPVRGGALVLSGPNAGGKTVALKTIGLLALMNQAGLPVTAREAVLPIFRQVLADIGDHQSIIESLSTFSARMVRVAWMIRELKEPALVLLDEVGAGTDPAEAGALAVAIVDYFRRNGAAVVVTTHHEALKDYAETASSALNASMEIDEETMRPTYRLMSGVAGRSGGVDLAERVGLPPEVLVDARSRLSSGHREIGEYAARLQSLNDEKEREIERLCQEREALERQTRFLEDSVHETISVSRERWRKAVDAALARIDEARDQFIAKIKDRTIALQMRAEARRESAGLREQLERVLAPPDESTGAGGDTAGSALGPKAAMGPGTRARLATGAGKGEIVSVESIDTKGRAQVLVRGKRMTVSVADLTPLTSGPDIAKPRSYVLPAGVRFERTKKHEMLAEINLIGARVEEALDRIDKFLDDAYLAGHREVRIIHGHGTGRLRAAIHTALTGHPHVESHGAADERAGGSGATVVILKG